MAEKPFDPQELQEIRAEFPALRRYVYLASNGLGLLPRRARRAATAVLRQLALDGIAFEIFHGHELVERARQRTADFFGASPDEIAFSRNTTEGLIWAAESLPWNPGDEVLLVRGSHPSTVLPFLVRQLAGLRVRWVRYSTSGPTLDDFRAAWGERTRAVVLSWVEFHNGFRHDLTAVGNLAHERGAWLVCDAVQGWGALPFEARTLPVDVAAAGAQKWLLGPPGIGVCYVARRARNSMRVLHVGAGSLANPWEPLGPVTSYDTEMATGANCFEEGTRNLPGIAALEASISLLSELGIGRIAAQIQSLVSYLAAEAERVGWRVKSAWGGRAWSGIVLLQPPEGENAEAWMHRLHQEHIAINHREGCLHLGIHFYNAPQDIDALVRALERS
ncbi:Cysteine desulfurase [bacterium HR30]|nr:Cysteine desulfurase [bacterium HR30]